MKNLSRTTFRTILTSVTFLALLVGVNANAVVRVVSTSPGPGEFGSLGAAVAASNGAGLAGDSIRVMPGVYDEAGIAVTVAGLSIQGMGALASDVVFSNATAPGTGTLIDWSGTSGGSMDNMTITGYDDGVSAPGTATGFSATGLVLIANAADGLDMRLFASSLTGNTAHSNGGSGILLRTAAGGASTVAANCLYNNGVGPTDNEASNIWSGNYYGGSDCVSPFPILGTGALSDLAPSCNENEVAGPVSHEVLATETYTFTYTSVGCIDGSKGLAAFDFTATFDPAVFEYVPGSAIDGNAIPGQLPMQVDESLASSGLIRLSAASGGGLDILTGTAMLASIDLKAIDDAAASTISVASDYRDGANNAWPVAGVSLSAATVDITAPTCANLTPNNPAGDDVYSEGGPGVVADHINLDVSIDIADDFDSRRIIYRIDGGPLQHFAWSAGGAGPETLGPVNIPLGAISDGPHTLKMFSEDVALNHGDTCSYSFMIDRTAPVDPTITLKDADCSTIDPNSTNDSNIVIDIVGDGTEVTMELWNGGWLPSEAFDGVDHPFDMGGVLGARTIFVRTADKYGNRSGQISDNIDLDLAAPVAVGPMTIAPDPTSDGAVSFTIAGHGGADAVEWLASETEADLDDCNNANWAPKAALTMAFQLASGDGTHTIYFASRDKAGNASNHLSATVEVDSDAGAAPAVVVSATTGEDCSDSWAVDVEVTYSQADAAFLNLTTNDGAVVVTVPATGSPQMVSYTYDATDRVCDSMNTVNVTVTDGSSPANVSAAGSDAIFVDCGVPAVTAVVLNNGDAWSQSATVTVQITGSADGVMVKLAELCASVPAATAVPIDMTGGTGSVTFTFPTPVCGANFVAVQLIDCAGRMSVIGCSAGVDFDDIKVDEVDPLLDSLVIDAGAALSVDTSVSVKLFASDNCGPLEMRLSEDASFGGGLDPFVAFVAVSTFEIAAGDGTHTVYAEVRDASSRLSAAASDGIDVDQTDPAVDVGQLFILSGNSAAAAGFTNSASGNSLEGINGPADVATMLIRDSVTNANLTAGWVPFDAASFALAALAPLGAEPTTLHVRIILTDNAGNVGPWTDVSIGFASSFASSGASAIPPGAASGVPGGSMKMSWPAQTGAQNYLVKYDRWGNYPFFNTPVPTPPATLSSGFPLAGPISVAAGSDPVTLNFDASIDGTPDIYAVSIWTVDMYGNATLIPNIDILETNYILGDGKGAANDFDNKLSFVDEFGLLADAMFTVNGDAGYNPYMDIGPTLGGDAKNYPIPDDAVEFEDLVIFAINFAADPAAKTVPGSRSFASSITVGASVPTMLAEPGSKIRVPISISEPNAAKGMHLVFDYDRTSLRLVEVKAGKMFETAAGKTFFAVRPNVDNIDINAVSLDAPTYKDNEVAVLTFEAITTTVVELTDVELTVRDAENQSIEVAFSSTPTSGGSSILPNTFALGQNYPNPFNPSTKINLSLPTASEYSIEIFNTLGQRVKSFEGYSDAGVVSVEWNASDNASGVYFYRVKAGAFVSTKKMVLLK